MLKRLSFVLALLLLARPGAAQIGTVLPAPVTQFVDTNGVPLSGGLLYACVAASACPGTPLATYSNSILTVPNTNPVVLDAAGRATVYLSPATYKFVLQTSAAVTVWTQDNVAALAPWNLNTVAGRVVYTAPTTLTIAASTVTPINNVHAIDTSGGAANLNTLTISGSVSSGMTVYLTANNGGANPVTVRTGLGNIVMAGGDYLMDGPTKWISLILKGTTWYELARAGTTILQDVSANSFRLSLTTGLCVTTADVTGASAVTIFWTPCTGNTIALYDGVATWNLVATNEISIAIPAVAGQMYDVFVYSNAGVATLELAAWTNDTTRATALTTQNGVKVKSGATTRRYLGSFRTTTVVGQTEDSFLRRFVWNYYNRVRRPLRVTYNTDTWNYSLAVWRQVDGFLANQLDIVIGVAEVSVDIIAVGMSWNSTSLVVAFTGIGEDSTAAVAANSIMATSPSATANAPATSTARLVKFPTVGRHFYAWLEQGSASNTTTWVGDNNTLMETTGMAGWIEG